MRTQTTHSRSVRIGAVAAVLIVGGLLLAGCSVPVRATESGTDRLGAVSRVEIDAESGTVTLRPGPAGAAQVDRVLRWTEGGAKPQVTQQVSGGVLRISATCPDDSDDCETDLTVTVPAATGVRADLGAGNVTVDGLTGAQDLTTGAGNVEGTRIGAGPVTARTKAGNVDVSFDEAPTTVDAQSTAGNVTVRVPSGAAYDVEATTTAGNSKVEVPDTPGAPHRVVAGSTAGNASVLPA